jgi:hypothetical protein
MCLDKGETGLGHDKETQEVRWVQIDEAIRYLTSVRSERDLKVALKARRRIRRMQSMLRFAAQNGA